MTVGAPVYLGNVVDKQSITNFIPQVWIDDILYYRDAQFMMERLCKLYNVVGQKGDTYKLPLVGRAAVYDRVPGQPVRLQVQNPGGYQATITKDRESSFGIDKIVQIQSQYDTMQPYTKEAGYAMTRDLDNFLLGLRATVPTESRLYRSTGANPGTEAGDPAPLDKAVLESSLQLMLERDVPYEELTWCFSPNQLIDLWSINEFVSKDYDFSTGNVPAPTGMAGTLYNIPVMWSTQIKNNTLTGYKNGEGATGEPTPGVAGSYYLPDQEDPGTVTTLARGKTGAELTQPFQTGMLVHPDWAIMLRQQNITAEASRETLLQMDALVTTQVFGGKSFRRDHAVLIFSQGSPNPQA